MVMRLFRRRRDCEPVLSSDHSMDLTADMAEWPTVIVLSPQIVQLAAMLRGLTPESRQVLEEAVSENGWPAWWGGWVAAYGWDAFKSMCLEALENYHRDEIPVENTLYACVEETATSGNRNEGDTHG